LRLLKDTSDMGEYSQTRNETKILEAVNTLIVSGEIKNPKLSRFASVSYLTLSKDNSYCTLYVTCLEENRLESSVNALQSAAAFIQGRLARVLQTKNTPKLTFRKDSTELEARRIDELLAGIKG